MQNPKVLFGFAVSGNEDEAVKTKDYHENQQEKFCVFNCHLLGFNTEKQEAAINTQSTGHVKSRVEDFTQSETSGPLAMVLV